MGYQFAARETACEMITGGAGRAVGAAAGTSSVKDWVQADDPKVLWSHPGLEVICVVVYAPPPATFVAAEPPVVKGDSVSVGCGLPEKADTGSEAATP